MTASLEQPIKLPTDTVAEWPDDLLLREWEGQDERVYAHPQGSGRRTELARRAAYVAFEFAWRAQQVGIEVKDPYMETRGYVEEYNPTVLQPVAEAAVESV